MTNHKQYSDLRDLADQIKELTRNHMAFNASHRIVANACDHLYALAGFEEQTHRIAALEIKFAPDQLMDKK